MKKYILIATAGMLTTVAVTATVLNNKKPVVVKKETRCTKRNSGEGIKTMSAEACKAKMAASQCSQKASVVKAEASTERTHCFD